ncbi:hypothetical protein WR25_14919 [Diploscapter pachys]|uniref:Uncharacterized protein n=1 Tax=Diploscapter pachys TaxID=2018661 RepID=A0A2A2J2R6_9BILA|nr:hypothetical protein WR25_14919 [Diploscapter pachys]
MAREKTYRHRIHGNGKVQIPKGMLCESNPSRNRHRQAAASLRNATFNARPVDERGPETSRNADSEALIEALPMEGMNIGNSSKSMVSDGGISKISQFTSCTNPAFDTVHRVWRSGSTIQSEVISVLAAVAELIKERNGTESDVEYFGALVTALESSAMTNPPRTAAIAYLLHLISKKVPKEVLQAQFTRVAQIVYTKLLENMDSPESSVLKNLLSVLGIVLRVQPQAVWNNGNTRNMLVSVAALCTHDKPWVRTMARRVVRAVLTDPVTAMDNGLHAASNGVGQLIQQQLQNALASRSGATVAVRYLCLLEGIMHKMPANLFKQLSETILKSFAMADSMVKCSALQCLHRSLQRQPCDAALPVETNALLVGALRQLAPPNQDIAVCAYWMQVLSESHVCLHAKDSAKCLQLLPATNQQIVKFFDVANEQLAQISYQVLSRIIEHCIQDDEATAKHLLTLLDEALNLRSTFVWKYVLRTQMRLYEIAGEGIVGPEFTKALETLAKLREHDRCFCKTELDFTIGSAVRYVGVDHVVKVLSLCIDADAAILSTEFPRSWLIPVLRVNIHNAPLSLFASLFLPLAMKIYKRLSSLDPIPQRLYTTVQMQLWELLPSFCESPSDLEKTFPELAPVLGAALNERKDLRLTVLSALRRALKFALQPDAPQQRTEVMGRYAKNFMPLLFNMYTSTNEGEYDDKGVRMSVLETIRAYAEVADKELLNRFVDSAIDKAKKEVDTSKVVRQASQKQARILDILCALSRTADPPTLSTVLDAIQPWFDSNDVHSMQKKAFRIIEEILQRRSSPEMEAFLENNDVYFENAVSRPLATITGPARAAWASCVLQMLDTMEEMSKLADFCSRHVDDIVLTLDKSNGTHARANASKCLQGMASRLIQLGAETEQTPSQVLHPILEHIYELANNGDFAGGNGSQPNKVDTTENAAMQVARATMVALNIIVQKQLKVLNATHLSRLISHTCTKINDPRPPVRLLVIRLARILVQKMPEFSLQQYRSVLLESILEGQTTIDVTIKIRKANRLLLEVLVDKFSAQVLEKYTKRADWLKQIKNVAKLKRKQERLASGEQTKEEEDDGETSQVSGSRISSKTAGADTILELLEDSDAEESDEEMETKSARGGQKSNVWLTEDADEVVDLLDTNDMINKVTTTDPRLLDKKKRPEFKKKSEAGFRFTKSGKLIITDQGTRFLKFLVFIQFYAITVSSTY